MPRPDPEERRTAIIDAARRRFSQTGYHGTSMDDIVAESGLSKGTLYWYFENKHTLFMAMLESTLRDMSAALEVVVAGQGPASQRLREVVKLFIGMMLAEKELGDVLVSVWVESRHEETFNTAFRDVLQPFIDLLAGLIEQGIADEEFGQVDAVMVASAIAGLFDGLWLQAMVGMPVEETVNVEALVDWMLDGLRPR